jgi:hypothetical protein
MELFKKIKKLTCFLIFFVSGILMIGCHSLQKKVGLRKEGADAFSVDPSCRLEIPPDFSALPSDQRVPALRKNAESLTKDAKGGPDCAEKCLLQKIQTSQ